MTRLPQWRELGSRIGTLALLAVATLSCVAATSHAAVTLSADPNYPAFPDIFTTNPSAFGGPEHAFIDTRMLRQTFQNDAAFDIGEIVLSLNLNGTDGTVGGLVLSLYTVEDVNAATWDEALSSLFHTWTVPTSTAIPATDQRLGVTFTGADVINLPQRNTDAQGYGIEFSSVDGVTNMGGLVVTPADNIDRYPGGVWYREDGTISRTYRDIGLSLLSDNAVPAVDGDVTNDQLVNLDDFAVISSNFRNSVGSRSEGDLNADGVVDFADFRIWKSNANVGAGASSAAIPEPASGLVAILGSLLMAGRRRRVARQAVPVVAAASNGTPRKVATWVALAAVATMSLAGKAQATVTLTVDPDYPATPGAFTLDPEGLSTAARNLAADRKLRQTFTVDETFFVGGVVLGSVLGGADGGLIMSFFQVDDVNATTWAPVGNPIKRITIPVGEDIP
ncbi:MAG: hypothetical protein KDA61_12530, partial [Planctomycetales bacterium]|nr:hypothetical protein [Planctomycetales bacterium]